MSSALYLTLMLSAVAAITAAAAPAILFPRCPGCGRRNPIERTACRHCGQTLPQDDD